jgi:DNA-binding transcriptional ArsR family regulator
MVERATALDSVFKALADPTRRAVVERLSRGTAPVSELAKPFGMALPSFMQHLDVLEKCGLVVSQKQGRVRTYRLEAQTLAAAEDWLGEQRALWARRLDQLDDYLTTLKPQAKGRRKERKS